MIKSFQLSPQLKEGAFKLEFKKKSVFLDLEKDKGRPQKKKHYFNSLKSPILESAWTQLSMLVRIHPGAADFPRKSNFPLSVPS